MAWRYLKEFFRDQSEIPFTEETTDTLVDCVFDYLQEDTNADPIIVVNAAMAAGRKAQTVNIRELYYYARRTIRRDVERSRKSEQQTSRKTDLRALEEIDGLTQTFCVDEAAKAESEFVVDQYLSRLPELDREVFWLREYEDLDHSTIAAALKISVASSRFKLYKAKKVLRPLLSKGYPRIER
jgi:RNA polymerase sigma factor (sigma-70 family)